MIISRLFLAALFTLVALIGLSGAALAQTDDPPANCIYVEQDGDFEAGGVWRFAETASPGFVDETMAHSGVRSAFVGVPADAENQMVDSTVWQKMRLPTSERITASLWLRSQPGDENDNRYIVVWDLETDESTVLLYEQATEEDWREVSVDLTPFAGKDILLVMGVHNDGENLKASMWVDDVHVIACNPSTATPAQGDTPATTPSPAASPTPTATPSPSPTLTPTPTNTPTPRPSPTAASPTVLPRPTATPAPTDVPTVTPTATLVPDSAPQRPRGSLPDNSALPLLAGVFFSGLVAVVVVILNLRH